MGSVESNSKPMSEPTGELASEYIFSTSSTGSRDPYYVTHNLKGSADVHFQVDSGAARTLMSEQEFWKSFPMAAPKIMPSMTELKRYGGSKVPACGEIVVKINFRQRILENQTILIVKDSGPSLLGRYLLPALGISIGLAENAVHAVDSNSVTSKFPELFKEELGTYKGIEVSLEDDEAVSPKFYKARNVPYAMRSKVDAELDRLLAQNIIEPVAHCSWAASIVLMLKSEGTVRICGDYRLTVNQVSKVNAYPVIQIDDRFATLGVSKNFSKLDMKSAYNQLLLNPESRPLTTINTQRGLFQYNRLCFGVASAPGIFQRTIEDLLRDIPGVCVFLDDILVAGSNFCEHEERLCKVLE